MRKQDEVPETSTEQPGSSQDGDSDMAALIKALAEMTWEGGKMPLVLLLKPSRRFEKLLAREVARAKRECGIHCWKRLVESQPDELKRRKKGGKR